MSAETSTYLCVSVREVLPHFYLKHSVETLDLARFDVFLLSDVELHAFVF